MEPTALKLGKGAAFVKSQLKRLRQEDETWEADFRALPKLMMQTATHYVGMVLSQPDGFLLADSEITHRLRSRSCNFAGARHEVPIGQGATPTHSCPSPRENPESSGAIRFGWQSEVLVGF